MKNLTELKSFRDKLAAQKDELDAQIRKIETAYKRQRQNAKQRGIEFLISIDEWWHWWSTDNRWESRGMGKDKLVMARYGDAGPYSLDNIYCTSHSQNLKDVSAKKRSDGQRLAYEANPDKASHLKVRGAAHPRSKPVMTPEGRFESAALAAEHFGVTRAAIHYRIKRGDDGWSKAPD